MTKIVESIEQIREVRSLATKNKKTIGFVPSMGNLHEGHASLLQNSRSENDIVILSLFVNHTQFNNPNDYDKYPRTFERDLELASIEKVDYVFTPSRALLYPDDYAYQISESQLSKLMEGKHRQGHFEGVLTVVMKLLQLVKPERAYFGEKDYQQLELIKGMVSTFFLETQIIGCPTARESEGLAYSSRNALLPIESHNKAHRFYQLLNQNQPCDKIFEDLTEIGFTVEYIEEYQGRRYGAVFLDDVRLIDNIKAPLC